MGEVVIWGEVLFCIDFCMDFCALYFTSRLLGLHTGIKRLCISAAVCAAAGVICASEIRLWGQAAVMMTALFIAVFLLISDERRHLRCYIRTILLFLFLEACCGGIMTALFYSLNRSFSALGMHVTHEAARFRWFLITAAVLFLLLGIISRMISDADVKKLVQRGGKAEIRIGERELHIPCLFDSGNLVREPISGKPVIFLPQTAQKSFGIDTDSLSDGRIPGSRLIPMRTLDAETLRWGIRPERMCLWADDIAVIDANVYLVFSDRITEAIVPTVLLQHRV